MDHLKGFLWAVTPMNKVPEIHQEVNPAKRLPEQRGPDT
jgi:hypothetical protein